VYKIYAESFRDAAHLRQLQDEAQSLVAGILTAWETKGAGSAGGV
jgi:phosphoglucomutase